MLLLLLAKIYFKKFQLRTYKKEIESNIRVAFELSASNNQNNSTLEVEPILLLHITIFKMIENLNK